MGLTLLILYGNLIKNDEYLLLALESSTEASLSLIACMIPYVMSMTIPFGFCLGLLHCYGKWSSNHEILALNSLGVGQFTIFKPSLVSGLILSVILMYLQLYGVPEFRSKLEVQKKELLWTNFGNVLESKGEMSFAVENRLSNSTLSLSLIHI